MTNIGPYLVGVAFWIFVAVAAVAGIVGDYKRRRFGVEILHAAIEKGQPLDPALIEKLTLSGHREEPIDPALIKLGGIITIAAGVGICLLSFFVARVLPIAFYPTLGAGAFVICVGIGLLIGSRALAEAQERERLRKNPA